MLMFIVTVELGGLRRQYEINAANEAEADHEARLEAARAGFLPVDSDPKVTVSEAVAVDIVADDARAAAQSVKRRRDIKVRATAYRHPDTIRQGLIRLQLEDLLPDEAAAAVNALRNMNAIPGELHADLMGVIYG